MIASKHRRTLAAIFDTPTRADLRWADIETLLTALGAETREGHGSRARFTLNGRRLMIHRPHPAPETKKGAVEAVRDFLRQAGITP